MLIRKLGALGPALWARALMREFFLPFFCFLFFFGGGGAEGLEIQLWEAMKGR